MAKSLVVKSRAAVQIVFFGIIALALSACGAMNSATSPVGVITGSAPLAANTLADDKALYFAEALYNVPAQAYDAANSSGKLPPEIKAVVKPKLVRMFSLLQAARTAKIGLDATTFERRVAELKSLRNQLVGAIPGVTRVD